jgi:hypothetical protein
MGRGRTVRPGKNHATKIEEILKDPDFDHVYFDLAWDEVAKYFVASPEATRAIAALMQRYPDRFLFGSDAGAHRSSHAPASSINISLCEFSRCDDSQSQAGKHERIFR